MKKGVIVYHKNFGKGRVVGAGEKGRVVIRLSNKAMIEVYPEDLEIKKTRCFEKVNDAPEDTILPTRGSKRSAGYDFYAPCDILVPAHGTSDLIFMNVKAKMRTDEFLYLKIRSGLSTKYNLWLSCSGIIDSDYYGNPDNDGNIGIKWRNNSDVDYVIKKGERCCQGIFIKYLTTDDDEAFNERIGGLGSTGK